MMDWGNVRWIERRPPRGQGKGAAGGCAGERQPGAGRRLVGNHASKDNNDVFGTIYIVP
jgi:hypothetical protein